MEVRAQQPWSETITHWLTKLPAVALLANIPFIVASRFFYLERAVINVDYFVFALVAPLFPKSTNLTIFGVLVALDLFLSISGAYYFKVAAAVRALKSVTHVAPTTTIPVLLVAAIAMVAWLRFVRRAQKAQSHPSFWVNISFVAVLGVAATGEIMPHAHPLLPANVVESLTWRALRSSEDFEPLEIGPPDYWRVESATREVAQELSSPDVLGTNIALVVVESWGLSKDASLNQFLQAPLTGDEIRSRYRIVTGTVPFRGSTVPGEFRELCGLAKGFRVAAGAATDLTGCLPWELRDRGMHTVAIHGFTRAMFNREWWYPKLGFERRIFAEDMPRSAVYHYCGSEFSGVCDSDAAKVVRQELLSTAPGTSPRKFVYWLTLSTHLELDDPQSHSDPSCIPPLQASAADVCALVGGVRSALQDVAQIAADQALPNTRFIIVGDHAPPFLLRSKRELFAQDRVPFIELIPGPQRP